MADLHDNLRRARLAAGFTLVRAGSRLKMDPSLISRMETGAMGINAEKLPTFAKLYKVSVAKLYGERRRAK